MQLYQHPRYRTGTIYHKRFELSLKKGDVHRYDVFEWEVPYTRGISDTSSPFRCGVDLLHADYT